MINNPKIKNPEWLRVSKSQEAITMYLKKDLPEPIERPTT